MNESEFKEGIVIRPNGSNFGVRIDGIKNEDPEYGVFWSTTKQPVRTNEITNTETRKELEK